MTRSLPLLLAAGLLVACASAPPPPPPAPPPRVQAPTTPPAERLARLEPFDRGALEFGGELVRLASVPAFEEAVIAGIRVRRGAAGSGPVVVAIRDSEGTGAYSYVGPVSGYRDGALANPGFLGALEKARNTSAFHQPVQAKVGASDLWCMVDKVPRGPEAAPGHRLTLTVWSRNPRAAAAPLPGVGGGRGGRGGAAAMDLLVAAKAGAVASVPLAVLELATPQPPRRAREGALGLQLESSTPAPYRSAPAPIKRGAQVVAVSPGGPADRAGIQAGDLVVAVNGTPVASPEDLSRDVAARDAFTQVTLRVLRDAERRDVPVTLGLRASSGELVRQQGTIATVADVWLEADDRLAAVAFEPLRPTPEVFLQGKTSRDVVDSPDVAVEQAFNDAVLEWKTRQLPGWLRQATYSQLEAGIVTTEKGILTLDVAVRFVKDQVDAAARKNEAAFAGAGQVEQLLEQRKMLLGVVLGAMKAAAAQKPR